MYQVKDAMNRHVLTVSPDATVDDTIHLLLDHNISGAPVLNEDGKLCGIITQFQLMEVLYDPDIKYHRVAECMTRNVLTIDETATLASAANVMILNRIRRLPVMRGDQLVGIVSREDLLRYFAETGEEIDDFFAKLKIQRPAPALAR